MAEMGLGYGSEYQLLRFLGHHRNELNMKIRENTKLKGELIWLDYPKNSNRLSLDGEYVGVDFLKDIVIKENFSEEIINKLSNSWRDYWPTMGTQPNWDGVIVHKTEKNAEIVIVEAKASLEEIKSHTNSEKNETINDAFSGTQNYFGITNTNWFGDYYQLANRLALIHFLQANGINASLLYIYFLNGHEKRTLQDKKIVNLESKSVLNKGDWEKAISIEYSDLGLSETAKASISSIFVDSH